MAVTRQRDVLLGDLGNNHDCVVPRRILQYVRPVDFQISSRCIEVKD